MLTWLLITLLILTGWGEGFWIFHETHQAKGETP